MIVDEPGEWDDDELETFGDDEDEHDDEETATIACRGCGTDVYEDALQCPVCGEYVATSGGSPLAGRPLWFVVLAVAGMIALIAALLGA